MLNAVSMASESLCHHESFCKVYLVPLKRVQAFYILGSLTNVYMMDSFCFIVSLPIFVLVIVPSLPLTMSLLSLQS